MKAIVICVIANIALVVGAYAFKLDPYSSLAPSGDSYTKKYFPPVHENLTLSALREAKEALSDIDINGEELIFGVRWNDDPLQLAKFHPKDFYIYYKDSCDRPEEINPTWDFLYRTHCGDMQFLHSMASSEHETARETKDKIMMWSEFSYKVSAGLIPVNYRFENLGEVLSTENAEKNFYYLLTNNGTTRVEWQAEDLFTLECDREFSIFRWVKGLFDNSRPTELKCKAFSNDHDEIAIQTRSLGSLLHLIQDSFSDSHVSRVPAYEEKESRISQRGKIMEFHIYTKQKENIHAKADVNYIEDDSVELGLSLKVVSSEIIRLSFNDRKHGTNSWLEVEEILKSVFEIDEEGALPTGGKYQ